VLHYPGLKSDDEEEWREGESKDGLWGCGLLEDWVAD